MGPLEAAGRRPTYGPYGSLAASSGLLAPLLFVNRRQGPQNFERTVHLPTSPPSPWLCEEATLGLL